jgi:toxin YhaV
VIRRHGWSLLFHGCFLEQTQKLHAAALRAQRQGDTGNANVKLFGRLSRLVLEAIPSEPGRAEYRIGNTLGPAHRHWRRAKIGRRFRLFFRYDTKRRIIIYAWVNDRETQRKAGAKTDPYSVFRTMLEHGNPPETWDKLLKASESTWVTLAETDPKKE